MIKIITISREFGSGGRTIGKEIAEKLGIPCYDKDFIEKIAEETGYAKEYIADEGEYAPNSNSLVSSLIFAVVMYPLMVSNVSCGMNLHYPWRMYAIVYVAVLVLYFVINGLLTKKLNRVNLAEMLKNRE